MDAPAHQRQQHHVNIAYQFIKNGILVGRFLPGDRLTESKIAAEAGVSRTPVREALRMLERDGVVVIEKHKGATITELSEQRISDIYEFRARMEGFAAYLAAERITRADQARLLQAAHDFALAVKSKPEELVQEVYEANRLLHQLIAQASDNAFLAAALSVTTGNPLVVMTARKFSATELQHSVIFHELIVNAIIQRQGPRAERLMIEHVLQSKDFTVEDFRLTTRNHSLKTDKAYAPLTTE